MIIYNALLTLGIGCVLPKWLTKDKYKGTVAQRLGFRLPKKPKTAEVIWLHGCSMGETRSLLSIFPKLKEKFPNASIYLSSTTKTGHEEAKRIFPGCEDYFFLPVDLPWAVKKVVNHLKPNLFLLAEGEFWPNLMQALSAQNTKILLVNGKISPKSHQRFTRFPFFSKRIFSSLDQLFVQSIQDASRFETLDIPKDKIVVSGNLKTFSSSIKINLSDYREKYHISPGDKVVTLGSTHDQEEEALLRKIPSDWHVLIAPRHPERFGQVKKLLETINRPRTQLVDEMGVLPILYQISDLAIVGGSFFPGVGGHNIFEPIQAHTPVLFGPHMETQKELVNLVLDQEAGIQTSLEQVAEHFDQALALKANAQTLAERQLRSSQKVLEQILSNCTCS